MVEEERGILVNIVFKVFCLQSSRSTSVISKFGILKFISSHSDVITIGNNNSIPIETFIRPINWFMSSSEIISSPFTQFLI